HHARERDVAVQHLVHLFRAEEEIRLLSRSRTAIVVGPQEPEALVVADHLAADEPGLVGEQDVAATRAVELAVALYRGDAPLDALALLGGHPEDLEDPL